MDLKTEGILSILRSDEILYSNTSNARYAWHAWQLARRTHVPCPTWVLRFMDTLAASEITKHTRKTDAADRYEAALTQMEVAVSSHRRRRAIRDVGKRLRVNVTVSRRDTPNLTAIARAAAKANGVSVNRLLARYRSSLKSAKR